MNTVGIDNGLDGAIVINTGGAIAEIHIMPTIQTGKKRIIDIEALRVILSNAKELYQPTFFCEIASFHSPGKMALCSTWRTFGNVEAVLTCIKVPREDVQPQAWQKTFWARPKMPKGQKFDTKAAALRAANMIWPDQDWTKNARCTVPHDGIVDAALISEYGRRKWN